MISKQKIILLIAFSLNFSLFASGLDEGTEEVLYFKNNIHDWIKDPIVVSQNNEKVGEIFFSDKKGPPLLLFSPIKGKKISVWRQYDYSGITKITQTSDESKIRIYYWYTFFTSREYVLEFDLKTHKKKLRRVKTKRN